MDANVEVLFTPWARTFGGYLRPAIGATVNFNGDTSKVYADVRWEIEVSYGVFFAIGLGAALHAGHLSADFLPTQGAGCASTVPPFRGARLPLQRREQHLHLRRPHLERLHPAQHEGMDTVGIRFGHRFGPLAEPPDNQDISIGDFSGAWSARLLAAAVGESTSVLPVCLPVRLHSVPRAGRARRAPAMARL